MRKLKPKFTQKQISFMKAYVVNQNATKAAIEAGYSQKTARQQGQRLLSNVDIRAMVDKALAAIAKKQEVRAEEVIRETRLIAFSNMLDYISIDDDGIPQYDLTKINRELGVAIKSFDHTETVSGSVRTSTTRIVLHDKLRALDKLDAATEAFRKHNKGMEEKQRSVIHVVSHIPGAPGSRVRRPETETRS